MFASPASEKLSVFRTASVLAISLMALNTMAAVAANPAFEANKKGAALVLSGKSKEAVEQFDQALKINPKYVRALANRASAEDALHQYDKAIADCSKAIELAPTCLPAFINRSWAYNNTNEFDKALADADKAVSLDDTSAMAHLNRSHALNKLG